MDPAGGPLPNPYISLHHISRRFGLVQANRDISLDIFEGEVHAIVGENGAGKSTLMKILNGELQPDSGEIRLKGRRVTFSHPRDAKEAGVGMAHQHFLIFPQLTALENVVVGHEPAAGRWLRTKQAITELLDLCRSLGFDLPLDSMASELSFAHRQQIEILRLLHRQAKVLILDEPTSLLTPPETERFLGLLQTLQNTGHTILFISHRLHEVLTVAHRVSVLSHGRLIGSYPRAELTADRLVRFVVFAGEPDSRADQSSTACALLSQGQPAGNCSGRKHAPESSEGRSHQSPGLSQRSALSTQHITPTLLELSEVSTRPGSREGPLDGCSLRLLQGEILGLGGIVGNGQHELVLVLAGLLPIAQGSVFLSGEDISHFSVSDRLARGICWLPANPAEEALLPQRSLWENLLLGRQRLKPFDQRGWLNRQAIGQWAAERLHSQQVVYGSLADPVLGLSGGNLQKLALSRVLDGTPHLIILEQPSRGLDFGAQEQLRKRILNLNQEGVSFLLISYDLDELTALCHRIGVLYRGRMMGIAEPSQASLDLLGSWMLGLEREA